MSKRTIGYIVYYVLFALFAIYGTVKHWPMQIFVAIILLVEILCCVGTDGTMSNLSYYTRSPTVAPEAPPPKRDISSLPFVSSLLILLPPILYFVIYTVVWCLL